MNRRNLMAGVLWMVMLLSSLGACAERSAPRIVGSNVYKKKPGEVQILPFTYAEAESFLATLARKFTVGDVADAFAPQIFTWSDEDVKSTQTLMRFEGKTASVTLVIGETPYGENKRGSGQIADLHPGTQEIRVAEFRTLVWRKANLSDTLRDVGVGANLEALLTAFGITEISEEGLIYDNDILYADEGSEDSDYAYHPEQHAIIYKEGDKTVVEFIAFQEHSQSSYALTYTFSGEKIATVALEKR